MTRYCDGHAFGCGCTEHCTKTVDLGRFAKTAPVLPVLFPSWRDMLVVTILVAAFLGGSTWMAQKAFERVRLANQETAQW